jgi:hypothetical protein
MTFGPRTNWLQAAVTDLLRHGRRQLIARSVRPGDVRLPTLKALSAEAQLGGDAAARASAQLRASIASRTASSAWSTAHEA